VSGLVQGTYVFRVTVKDNDNATSFADVSIIVNAAELPPGTSRYVRVNIYGGSNAYNNAGWNDWNVGVNTNPLASGLFKYDDGTTSGISAVLSNQSLVSDNGSGYGTTMCPSAVGRTASYYTATRTLTISGLDNSKQYSLELYASRNSTASGVSRFTVGSTSVDIATDNNFSNKASFVSLTPSGGKIVVTIAKLNNFNYVNGFVLTETVLSASFLTRSGTEPDNKTQSSLSVYPNPVKDQFVLTTNTAHTGKMQVQIVDAGGVIRQNLNFEKPVSGAMQTRISLKGCAPGLYLLRVSVGNWSQSISVLK
jgi:hypothetical protein